MTDTHDDEESSDLGHDPAYHALFPEDDGDDEDDDVVYCNMCGGYEPELVDHGDGNGYICVYCNAAVLLDQNPEPESEPELTRSPSPSPASPDPEPEPDSDHDEPSNHDAKRQRLG